MKAKILSVIFLGIGAAHLPAGIVVVSSVPSTEMDLEPLTSLGGVLLAGETQVLIGAFPGMSDEQILDLASQNDLSGVTAAFVPFGNAKTFGQGVGGKAGAFEIALKGSVRDSQLEGETVSILIQNPVLQEFLVARFPGKSFVAQSETGLEPFVSLHLSTAKIIVGNRTGGTTVTTATAPSRGSFDTWISGFPAIIDPALKLPEADADSDGRSNFLEYTTGGNPTISGDPPPFWVNADSEGALWANFTRIVGLGSVNYAIQSSEALSSVWIGVNETVLPAAENFSVMKMRLPVTSQSSGFFRLHVAPGL